MIKGIIKENNKEIPYLINENKSKNMLIFFHGLDGTAASVKPLVRALGDQYTIVAPEHRGHELGIMKAARRVSVHLEDYITVINHFKEKGYKIWLVGESMGAALSVILAYRTDISVEGIFAVSIPNRLVDIMIGSRLRRTWIQFMTLFSFLFWVDYVYKADMNYKVLSRNKVLIKISNMETLKKKRHIKNTLATWKANKTAWKLMGTSEPNIPIYYFNGLDDVLVIQERINEAINNKKNIYKIDMDESKHILTWEPNSEIIWNKIKEVTNLTYNFNMLEKENNQVEKIDDKLDEVDKLIETAEDNFKKDQNETLEIIIKNKEEKED